MMVDSAIIAIVILLLFLALKGSVKHFRGEGTCCGGSKGAKRSGEKHLDGPVIAEREIRISGMYCENCARRIKDAIEEIDGVSATVDFTSGKAIVRMDRSIDDISLKCRIEEAGYSVDSIR